MVLDKNSYDFFNRMKEMYAISQLPTCLLDAEFFVIWANDAAIKACPIFNTPNGKNSLLFKYDLLEMKAEIAERGSFAPPSSQDDPFCGMPIIIYRSPADCDEFYILNLREWSDTGTGTQPQGLAHSLSNFECNFRLPLGIISSSLSILNRKLKSNLIDITTMSQYIRLIGESSTKLERSYQMFITYTRLINGIYYDKFVRVELYTYLESFFEEIAIILKENNVDFSYNINGIYEKSLFMLLAKEPFNFIICQLISNSCRFTKPGNFIRIDVVNENNIVDIIVTDRGCGISPSISDRVFNPFFSQTPDNSDYPGSGLGLPIAQECAAYLKGTLSFVSTEGEGSTFRLSFPIIDDSSQATEARAPVNDYEIEYFIKIILADALPCVRF